MLFERIKLEDDEQILCIVRKHWWIIFTNVTGSVLLTLLPLVILVLADVFVSSVAIWEQFITPYVHEFVFGYLLWILINWMIIANYWTDQYLDLWAVTNRRVVSIDQKGFFNRLISSFRLERLQDMNVTVSGIIPTLLNFGTIEAQTASSNSEDEFRAKQMPDPRGLKALIIRAADERQRSVSAVEALKQDGTL